VLRIIFLIPEFLFFVLHLDLGFFAKSLIFEISDLMLSYWISFLAYPNLFGIKGFVFVVFGPGLELENIFVKLKSIY
jgi:hypothetical protein